MVELKPCPFCGGTEVYLIRNCFCEDYVRCSNCGAEVWGNEDEKPSRERAIELWNTRALQKGGK